MRNFFLCRNDDEGGRRVSSYEGKLELDGQVASEGMKSIGNVGSESGSVQCGNRSNKILSFDLRYHIGR